MMLVKGLVRLNALLLVAGGLALVLMALHVSLDAFGKYALSMPIPATLEIVAYYYMPAVVALPLAFVEMRNGHVTVDLLFEMFPPPVQKLVLLLNGLVTAGFLGTLCWLAGREALRKFLINEFMFGEYPIIIWPGRVVFTLGFAFLTLVVVVKLASLLFGVRDPFVSQLPPVDKEDAA
jgi:TRAP-type C4-dicarboxylate transport system permease small subunit